MQQWDALHSMLIFVLLDMREIIGDESEGWKLTPPVKGLGSPFLLKVWQFQPVQVSVLSAPLFHNVGTNLTFHACR
jgi:hypothetical protein